MNGCSITDAGLIHIATLPKLRVLYIFDLSITDTGIGTLSSLQNLETLSVAKTQITDSALLHIAELPNLRELILDDTLVTAAGITHLSSIPYLTHLGLANTTVSDDWGDSLIALRELTNLNLQGTEIQLDGVARLRSTLPNIQFVYYDADRLLSRWAVTLGGEVTLRVGEGDSAVEHVVTSADQIPGEPFVIIGMRFGSMATISGGELLRLGDLREMIDLDMSGVAVSENDIDALHAAIPGCRIEWDGGVIEPMDSGTQ